MLAVDELLRHPAIWRAGELASGTIPAIASGHAALDAALPGGGWPLGALTEILTDGEGRGEVSLLLPALADDRLAGRGVLWVDPPYLPYAPALQNAGVPLAQCRVALPESSRDALWVTEQALRSGACGAVLAWIDGAALSFSALRRLHTAAEHGEGLVFLFRPLVAANTASPAVLRVQVEADAQALLLHILKRRGPPLAAPLRLNVRDARWPVKAPPDSQALQVIPATSIAACVDTVACRACAPSCGSLR